LVDGSFSPPGFIARGILKNVFMKYILLILLLSSCAGYRAQIPYEFVVTKIVGSAINGHATRDRRILIETEKAGCDSVWIGKIIKPIQIRRILKAKSTNR
jgi:putative copper export protein